MQVLVLLQKPAVTVVAITTTRTAAAEVKRRRLSGPQNTLEEMAATAGRSVKTTEELRALEAAARRGHTVPATMELKSILMETSWVALGTLALVAQPENQDSQVPSGMQRMAPAAAATADTSAALDLPEGPTAREEAAEEVPQQKVLVPPA